MSELSVYIRAQQGDLKLTTEFECLTFDAQQRCVASAAQFGQTQLLEQLIAQCNIQAFAEHALWVAAHDLQFGCVDQLTPLVPPTSSVWESVLRYAIKHNCTALQHTILAFEPPVNVNSCLIVTAAGNNKDLMETLLERSTHLSAEVVLRMMDNRWSDLVDLWVQRLPSEEKNKLFVGCVEQHRSEQDAMFEVCKNDLRSAGPNALAAAIKQNNWALAEQLVTYCDVGAAVKIIAKLRPNQETQDRLQRLVLLAQVGSTDAHSAIKRKI